MTEKQPLVSIVISVYNDTKYFKQAIDSVLNQSYTNWELIIVDDGSDEDIFQWMVLNIENDKRIKVITLDKNMGLHAARNEGIKQSNGEYIAILDADDIMIEERLQNSVAAMQSLNVDLLYGAWMFIDAAGNRIGNLQLPLNFEDNIRHMNPICHGTVMMKRSALGNELYPTFNKLAMDYALWWRMYQERKKIGSIPVLLTKYRTHPGSITQAKHQEQEAAKNEIIKHYTDMENEKKKNMVSIIMPTYSIDKQKDISKAVGSIIGQEYKNWELIIVNDGGVAPDNKFKNDSRIRYIEIEHKGLSGALNAGLKHVKGGYIAFLDDDDLWHCTHLQTLYQFLQSSPNLGMCYAQTMAVDKNGKELRKYNIEGFDRQKQRQMNLFTICSTLTRKECFDAAGKFDESLQTHMDYDMWLRICKYYNCKYVDKITSYYVQHSEQMSNNPQHLKDRDTVKARWQ